MRKKGYLAPLVLTAILLLNFQELFGGTETVADLQALAAEAIQEAQEVRNDYAQLERLLVSLDTDATLRQKVFTAIQAKNTSSVQSLLSQQISGASLSVSKLDFTNSYTLVIPITTKRRIFSLCISFNGTPPPPGSTFQPATCKGVCGKGGDQCASLSVVAR